MSSSRRYDLVLPSVVYLYDEPSSPSFRIGVVADFLRGLLPDVDVLTRKEFLSFHTQGGDELARVLASSKVRGIDVVQEETEPLYGEVQFERRILSEPSRRIIGILYDGIRLQRVFREQLPDSESHLDIAHIAFTNRLFCTYEKGDNRYHARVIMCGYPSLISTTGIVEAPAKPREFYAIKQKYHAMGTEPHEEELKAVIEGRFVDYDDKNLTQALKGYAMQAIFHHSTGEPFCEDKDCVLFNAHWQEELINAQIVSGQLCERHKALLKDMERGHQG